MHIEQLLVWAGDGGVSQESFRVRKILEEKI